MYFGCMMMAVSFLFRCEEDFIGLCINLISYAFRFNYVAALYNIDAFQLAKLQITGICFESRQGCGNGRKEVS